MLVLDILPEGMPKGTYQGRLNGIMPGKRGDYSPFLPVFSISIVE